MKNKRAASTRSVGTPRERTIGVVVLVGCIAAIYAGLVWTMRRFDGRFIRG